MAIAHQELQFSSYKNSTKILRLSEEIENYDVKKQFAKAQFETIRNDGRVIWYYSYYWSNDVLIQKRLLVVGMHTENFQEVTFTDSE
ncbi:MAG: hypothetical protein IPF75_05245 [Bacteroidetes bacterium]|nr:hypothetical protein [Bacteroidota bacterium]